MNELLAKVQCPYCGVGCGLDIVKDKKGRIKVKGDYSHPSSKGDICIKPIPLPKVMDIGRVPAPLYRESKKEEFREISWEEAFDIIVQKLKQNKPDENYFYLSGQLFTEDIYVINKFIKGFIKTNNVDANSRLCMTSAVMGYKLAFGSDGPPASFEDIDYADAFVLAGSNAAWTHPVAFKRMLKRKKSNPDTVIVAIDPVYTETAEKADIWIPIKPGTDTVLFNSVLYLLNEKGWIDKNFIQNHTEGFEEALEEAKNYPPEIASKICDIDPQLIEILAQIYGKRKKVLSFWTMGLNQSSNGTMKNIALINLHLATGRLNEKGSPFSLTGQPNAMGGREVGYLVNGLPGYRDVRNEEDRNFIEKFWKIPKGSINPKPGKTVVEIINHMLTGEIKLFWIVCTNPAVTMPNLEKFWKALENTFVIVQDAYLTDSMDFANLVLPATQWGEKEGVMTGSDRTVTFNQKFKQPPPQCKHDWEIFAEIAKRLGWEKWFSYETSEDIFNEYKKSTSGRLCDISEFSYEQLPKQWGGKWLYKNLEFKTPSKKAKFNRAVYQPPADRLDYPFSFILTTGRTKKQWHTMTRTGKSFELVRGEDEPYIMINEDDAYELGIIDGDYITVESPRGKIYIKAKIADIKKGVAFAPFGYGLMYHYPTNIVVSDALDPISKEPELKFSAIYIKAKKKKIASLSLDSKELLKSSLPKIKDTLDTVLEKMYDSLFELYPELKNMFTSPIKEVSKKQASLLIEFAQNIDNIENLEPKIEKVVYTHIKKKVQPKHYALFAKEFIKTLKEYTDLDDAQIEAWKEGYNYIANILSAKEKRIYEKNLLTK
ncbi:MAG: molybdopterin-dependent oxidoreductase [Aquificae bacterium]|nr:molybdopterin-dependent oxidoreductase [Aquificota bacterium]